MTANDDAGEKVTSSADEATTMPMMPAMPGMPRISELPQTSEMPAVGLPKSEVPAPAKDEPEVVPPRRGGVLRTLAAMVAAGVVVFAVIIGLQAFGKWPSFFSNPFDEKKTDRTGPVLLRSIQDLSRFVAAEGNFQVVIDLQQNRSYIPDFLVNERVLFVAAGTVDAYVDFSTIGSGAIETSADRKTVRIKLPAPALAKPSIDNDRSYVFAQQRGLVNRVGDFFGSDPNRMQQVYKLAEAKIGDAAKGSGLTERAQVNTTKMLEGMLRSLGYETVNISYAAP